MQHVLITGCSSGIGYCIARELAKSGYRVLATCRQPDDVERLAAAGISSYQLDLSDSNSISRAVEWALAESDNHIYGLINNGAYGQPGAVEDLSRPALAAQFETNVFGTQELTNLIIPGMRKHNQGRIIQISSILGLVCLPYRGAYNASKYALEALTDTLRLELRNSAIKVSLIEPGPIESDFRKNALQWFYRHIDIDDSVHKAHYTQVLSRLEALDNVPFTLPASAVLDKVIHALDSNRPRIRYRVTTPAIILAFLKRVFPDRLLDELIGRKLR